MSADVPASEVALPVRVLCVGGIVRDRAGRLLLIRRAQEPGRGLWSVPGGRVEAGETGEQAVAREVEEETGLTVEVGRLVGRVERRGPGGEVYDIADHLCRPIGGRLRAGSDADDARWVDALGTLPLTEGLEEALRAWGVLPDRSGRPGDAGPRVSL